MRFFQNFLFGLVICVYPERVCRGDVFEMGRDPTVMPSVERPLKCSDLLGSVMPMNTDPAIGSIWQKAYYFCVSKISLEACLIQVLPEEAEHIAARLREITLLCEACLMALTASYFVFRNLDMRHQINMILANGKIVNLTSD